MIEEYEEQGRQIEDAARGALESIENAQTELQPALMAVERLAAVGDIELYDGAAKEGRDLDHELAAAARALRNAHRIIDARVRTLDEESQP